MKRIIKYGDYPEMTYHLVAFLPFGQGICLGFLTLIKPVLYKDVDEICWEETNDVIKHEYSHFVLWKTKYLDEKNWLTVVISWIKFIWAYVGWKGMMLAFPHSVFPFEVEANKIKATL